MEGVYDWFDFGGGIQDQYDGESEISVDSTGVAMGDFNGDGTLDVVESNNVVSDKG
jgi:hypothetical protein